MYGRVSVRARGAGEAGAQAGTNRTMAPEARRGPHVASRLA